MDLDTYSLTIDRALAAHYTAHGLPADGGEHASWFRIRVGALSIPLPNPPARRRAVFFHDVNHVLTGYDTSFGKGEMQIAAFEIGNGCGPYVIAWYINLSLMALGAIARPHLSFAAFVRGRRCRSIYRRAEDRAQMRGWTVGALRHVLQLDASRPVPRLSDRLHFGAWTFVASAIALLNIGVPVAVTWGLGTLVRSALLVR
jgi:hypothetical protein